MLRESMTDVRDGARPVVGHAVDHHRSATDAIAFIAHLLVVRAFETAGAALGRAVDRILWQVLLLRLVDGETQSCVHGRVSAAAEACGDRDLLDEAREYLAALRVLALLAVLDVRPLAVTRHTRAISR
jgi:hypothetical protein